MCAKLATKMSQKQWNEWVSPDIDCIKVCLDLPVAPDSFPAETRSLRCP